MHTGVYIQVPFCQSKCTYCHFGTGVFPREGVSAYVDALCRELRDWRALYAAVGIAAPPDGRVDTVYLGGGTPSLLAPELLARILDAVRDGFGDDRRWQEATLEADPETVNGAKVAGWRAAGINRVSLGAQSFSDAELRAAGRQHREADIYRAVEALRDLSEEQSAPMRLNLDLILGLAGQTRASWQSSLEKLVALRPEHVSVYMLDVDEGSRLGRELLAGGTRYAAATVPGEEELADWFDAASVRLAAAGYEHYEISNWALPGCRAAHNSKYWQRVPYLGFGAGAHSFNGCERWANAHDPAEYVAAISAGRVPAEQRQEVTPHMALEEEVFLGMRLLEGINLARIEAEYGVNLRPRLPRLIAAGAVALEGDILRLLPERLSVSNDVMAELLV